MNSNGSHIDRRPKRMQISTITVHDIHKDANAVGTTVVLTQDRDL